MKKIIFILLILALLFTAGCTSEVAYDETETEDQGYIPGLEDELDTSDLDALDNDLDLGWI
tara:strand:- start:3705 stop:3887 length:183 start_codon:yes stop_codon:yes gene_type:complete